MTRARTIKQWQCPRCGYWESEYAALLRVYAKRRKGQRSKSRLVCTRCYTAMQDPATGEVRDDGEVK